MTWDVFIAHASENKENFVLPLANELTERGLKVWYDDFTLRLGDSLRRSIDKGLAESDFGIVVLSPDFFRKEWPQKELDGLAAREAKGDKVILPIWHNVSRDDVEKYSPILADRKATSTSEGLDKVVERIIEVVRPEPPEDETRKRQEQDWKQREQDQRREYGEKKNIDEEGATVKQVEATHVISERSARWYQSRTIQGAIIAGIFVLVAALIPMLKKTGEKEQKRLSQAPQPSYEFYFQKMKKPDDADGTKYFEMGFKNLTDKPLLNFEFTALFHEPIESIQYVPSRSSANMAGGDYLNEQRTRFNWRGNQIMEDGGWVVFTIKSKTAPVIAKLSTKLLGRAINTNELIPPDLEGLRAK